MFTLCDLYRSLLTYSSLLGPCGSVLVYFRSQSLYTDNGSHTWTHTYLSTPGPSYPTSRNHYYRDRKSRDNGYGTNNLWFVREKHVQSFRTNMWPQKGLLIRIFIKKKMLKRKRFVSYSNTRPQRLRDSGVIKSSTSSSIRFCLNISVLKYSLLESQSFLKGGDSK